MPDKNTILDAVRAALASEPRIGPHGKRIALDLDGGTLTIEGEVGSVAAKKLALEHAAAIPAVTGIVDRLRVTPAQNMGDREIRDHLRNALLQEPAFSEYAVSETVKGEVLAVRQSPLDVRGAVNIEVQDGVVTLNGQVQGLDDKRLAGVLAWWVPGARDVVNGLAVEPPEEDSDDLIAEAVRLALEKDRLVDESQIRVGVRGGVVTLGGLLPNEDQRDMVENDAWYVFGILRVENRIEVGPS